MIKNVYVAKDMETPPKRVSRKLLPLKKVENTDPILEGNPGGFLKIFKEAFYRETVNNHTRFPLFHPS